MNYSADVTLSLLVAERKISLAAAGPNEVRLRTSEDIPQDTHAVLLMTIDGVESRWEIVLNRVLPGDDVATYRVIRYPDWPA